MTDITHKDVTVAWESGYDPDDSTFGNQEYIITLLQYGEGDTTTETTMIKEKLGGATDQEVTFVGLLQPSKRYKVQVVTKIRQFPAGEQESTPKELSFRSRAGELL